MALSAPLQPAADIKLNVGIANSDGASSLASTDDAIDPPMSAESDIIDSTSDTGESLFYVQCNAKKNLWIY